MEKISFAPPLALKLQWKCDLLEGVYAVALEPDTGKVLAMAGVKHQAGSQDLSTNALEQSPTSSFQDPVVKRATLTIVEWSHFLGIILDRSATAGSKLLSILGLPNTVVVHQCR